MFPTIHLGQFLSTKFKYLEKEKNGFLEPGSKRLRN